MGRPQQPNPEREQRVADWLTDPTEFTGTTFNCFIDPKSLTFMQGGAMKVSFIIPTGQVESALPLRHLTRQSLPLTVTVTVNEDFTALRTQQIANLRLVEEETYDRPS